MKMPILELRPANNLLELTKAFLKTRSLSNKSAIFTKIRRPVYFKYYPVKIIQPDGSSFTIRYFEPRKIIQLPLVLSNLTEEERNNILENRKSKKKVAVEEEDFTDTFNSKEYLKKIRKI